MHTSQPGARALSVIIATYNRGPLIEAHLRALAAQDADPSTFDVYVVDDGSTDDTMARLEAIVPTLPFHCWFRTQPNAGASVARNLCLAASQAPLVLFVNDDTLPDAGVVSAHLAFHRDNPSVHWGAVGAVSLASEFTPTAITSLHHAQWDALRAGESLPFTAFITANVSVKRAMLDACGVFDAQLRWHEDAELGRRLVRGGLQLRYLPEAHGRHHHAITEPELRRMARRDGAQLVAWFRRDPQALDDLTRMGLAGPPPLRRTTRQRISALLVSPVTAPILSAVARGIEPISRSAAIRLWRAIFVHERRQAIRSALRAG